MIRIFISLIVLLTPVAALAAVRATVYNPAPFQGETVIVAFQGRDLSVETSTFDNQPAAFFPYKNSYRLVFGVPATKRPGVYSLKVKFQNGETFEKQIRVRPKKFSRVVLGIPKKLGLTPSALTAKLHTEKKKLEADIFSLTTPEVFFSETFGLPLADNRRIGSPFGEIRKTGNTEIRHLGVDFGASLGRKVGAMNAGVVKKSYFDEVYGNSVIIDHGQGIYSLYLHLDKTLVAEGAKIKRGTVVGTVGQSGYSTAPHLHLSVKIGNVAINPLQFVSVFR